MFLKNQIVFSSKLSIFPDLCHGFSTRYFGNLKIKTKADLKTDLNRENFAKALNLDGKKIISPKLVQKDQILILKDKKEDFLEFNQLEADGLITSLKEIYLMVTAADCLVIFYYEPNLKIVGLAHCGWQGLLLRFPGKMIEQMKKNFAAKPQDIIVFISPSIGPCHFEVKDDVAGPFLKSFGEEVTINDKGRQFVNLWQAAKIDLMEAGILNRNIEFAQKCTYCEEDLFFSWRRDKGEICAMAGVLGLKD